MWLVHRLAVCYDPAQLTHEAQTIHDGSAADLTGDSAVSDPLPAGLRLTFLLDRQLELPPNRVQYLATVCVAGH